jgi:hypothetical protein
VDFVVARARVEAVGAACAVEPVAAGSAGHRVVAVARVDAVVAAAAVDSIAAGEGEDPVGVVCSGDPVAPVGSEHHVGRSAATQARAPIALARGGEQDHAATGRTLERLADSHVPAGAGHPDDAQAAGDELPQSG